MQIRGSHLDTSIGLIRFAVRGDALCALGFVEQWPSLLARLERRFGPLSLREDLNPAGVTSRLRAYLEGDAGALDAILVDPGGTPFQARVWAALRQIPPGATIAYSELAARLGAPRAVRAVGAANGANPVSIVIPCHRVIGAAGDLRGYAGGLPRKRWLLDLEQRETRETRETRERSHITSIDRGTASSCSHP
jgi:methylated-DNA-[protein]-cysteine S-methyltransferase